MVEIEGERVLAASCLRKPTPGMKVGVATPRAEASRKMVFELLVADQPERATSHDPDSKFWNWADKVGVTTSRFPQDERPVMDISHPAMAVNLDACINCNLCVRACREVQVNDVIGMAGRGHHEKIVFDFNDPMGDSSCVACGECVQACPTGALMPSVLLDAAQTRTEYADRTVDSLCPFCGVGCQLTYHIKDDKILHVTGKDGPANQARLCVKGRFGYDYANHPDRLTVPLIRKDGVPKSADDEVDPANPWTHFREATWEEAMERAAAGLLEIRERKGGAGLAGFGSAKGSNEEAYLFQKLVRTGFGTNNVDHCTRLCHASSVAALFEGIGSGAVTAPFSAALDAETIIVIGANPTSNHPVAATFIKNAVKRGAKLIVADPRGQGLSRHATINMRFKPGSDVALLNAMLHTIVTEGLTDKQYIAGFTEGFPDLVEKIGGFSPEAMEPVCGVPAETIRTVARMYARSRASIIFWGMGISQHVHGTDNARCLIALALVTGQVGAARHRPASAARPEQRAGRVRRRPDPDVLSRLPAGRIAGPRPVRGDLGQVARSQARPDRGRDHDRDPRRPDRGHVHHGREPRDVGPRRASRAPGAGQAEASRRAGHLPHRDRVACRRGAAGLGLPREGRAPSPTPTAGCSSAARRCRCPARRGSISTSSSISPIAWAAAGATRMSARSIPRWRAPCRRSRTSAGSGW